MRTYSLAACLTLCLVSQAALTKTALSQTIRQQIGYDKLLQEVGALPNGAGIRVGIVEAYATRNSFNYLPDLSDNNTPGSWSYGKSFQIMSSVPGATTSNHSTSVANRLVGNQLSVAPGVTGIDVYSVTHAFLPTLESSLGNATYDWNVSVMNHSYVFNISTVEPVMTASRVASINTAMDSMIHASGVTNVVGLNNGMGSASQGYAQSYNSIVVGRTDGGHSRSSSNPGWNGRVKPDLVAPGETTSYATPIVSSAAALMHSVAQELGADYADARMPETMKAILMAGADKTPFDNWSNSSTKPLDAVYGAGEVDVYNSYKILTGGEFDGLETLPLVGEQAALAGWDYGAIAANSDLFWQFEIGAGQTVTEASILLTWHAIPTSTTTVTVPDMSLSLYRSVTDDPLFLVGLSDSSVDNVEHLYFREGILTEGIYTLKITSNLASNFGFAWNITAVPEPGSITLLMLGAASTGVYLRRRNRPTSLREVIRNRNDRSV